MAQLGVLAGDPATLLAVRPRKLGLLCQRWAAMRRGLAVLLVTAGVMGVAQQARASAAETLLFLGIQRSTTIDKLASQIIIEHLQERGENLLKTPNLSDTDRRCRKLPCLAPLAQQRQAVLVLDGDVQQVAANRMLRVVMHLYDSRQRQQHELENLCADCDETKLGIVLTNTTTDLLGQYRKTAVAMDQLAALLDAPPVATRGLDQATGAVQAAGAVRAASNAQSAGAAIVPDSRGAATQASMTAAAAPTQANGSFAQQATQTSGGFVVDPGAAPTPNPAQYPPRPGDSGPPMTGPGPYPTPMPPLPPPEAQPPQHVGKRGLSTKRKAIAGVFGTIGIGTLVASVVMTVLDHRLASNQSYNPSGSPCVDPQYSGQNCVLSTIRLWAPGYGVGALFLGGMILTLTIPERDSRP